METTADTIKLAEVLANNGDKYRQNAALGSCATCGSALTPNDVLTITSTWRETGACDSCKRRDNHDTR